MFSISRRLLNKNWKFLPNRERIIYKNRKEAFFDFVKVSGANILWQIGLAVIVLEFAFPTPDIVYDLKRLISPDFDLFCKSGNLVDFEMDFENKLRSIRREEVRSLEQYTNAKGPEANMNKVKTEMDSGDRLDTKNLATALPDGKADNRPKYVQILQDNSGQRPLGTPSNTPMSLGATTSSTDPPASDKKAPQKHNKNNSKNDNVLPNGKQQFRVYLKKQEIVPLPAGLPTRELAVATDNVLYFNGPSNFLSALYPAKFNVDGNAYNSVEHYYQACKLYDLVGQETAAELKSAATPIEVKKTTKLILKGKATPKAVSEWKAKHSIPVLKHAITEKFVQNEELKNALLKTGDKILIQTYIGDNFYAVGAGFKFTSGWVARHLNQSLKVPVEVSPENVKYLPLIANGKNVLGWILMQVREELRAN